MWSNQIVYSKSVKSKIVDKSTWFLIFWKHVKFRNSELVKMGHEHHFLMFSFNCSKLRYISKSPNEIPRTNEMGDFIIFLPSLLGKTWILPIVLLILLSGLQTDRGLLLGEEPHVLQLSGSYLICFWRTELGFLDSRYRLNNNFQKVSILFHQIIWTEILPAWR